MVATNDVSTQVVLIKAKMGNEFRRFRMAAYNADMDRLTSVLRHHFAIDAVTELKVSYEDADGDFIRMSTDYDFVEACHHALPKEQGEWEMVVMVETSTGSADRPGMARRILGLVREWESQPSSTTSQTMRIVASSLENAARRVQAAARTTGKVSTGHVEFGDFQMAESVTPETSNYETVQGQPFNVFREIERGEEEEDLLEVPGQAHSDDTNRTVPMQVLGSEDGGDDDQDDDEVDLGCVDGNSLFEFHRHLRYLAYKSFDPTSFPCLGDSEVETVTDVEETPIPPTESRQSIFWGPPAISGPSVSFPTRFNKSKIFTVPFPATFSFPPSPSPIEPVFSLSENTPFPFSPTPVVTTVSASTSTSTIRKFTRSTGTSPSVRTSETCVQTARSEVKKSVTEVSTQTNILKMEVPSIFIENTASNEITEVAVCVPIIEEPLETPIVEELEADEDLEEDEEELEGDETETVPYVIEEPLSPISPVSVASDSDDFVVV